MNEEILRTLAVIDRKDSIVTMDSVMSIADEFSKGSTPTINKNDLQLGGIEMFVVLCVFSLVLFFTR